MLDYYWLVLLYVQQYIKYVLDLSVSGALYCYGLVGGNLAVKNCHGCAKSEHSPCLLEAKLGSVQDCSKCKWYVLWINARTVVAHGKDVVARIMLVRINGLDRQVHCGEDPLLVTGIKRILDKLPHGRIKRTCGVAESCQVPVAVKEFAWGYLVELFFNQRHFDLPTVSFVPSGFACLQPLACHRRHHACYHLRSMRLHQLLAVACQRCL